MADLNIYGSYPSIYGSKVSVNIPQNDGYNKQTGNDIIKETAPDGGWGWVVVCACFLVSILIGIHLAGFSILYVEIVEYYQCDLGKAGWIGSMHIAAGNFMGLFNGVLIDIYGCRVVGMLGGILYFAGLLASSFAPNIEVLMLTYGFIAGNGFGMSILASMVIIQQYFDKKRTIAASIGATGNSLGVLISGPLMQALVDEYGWKGCMMLLAAITLNAFMLAALYRPLDTKRTEPETEWTSDILISSDIKKTPKQQPNSVCQNLGTECRTRLCDWSVFGIPVFAVSLPGFLLITMAYFPFQTYVVSRSVHYNLDRQTTRWLPTLMGIALLVGRFIFGWVGNMNCTNLLVQHGLGALIAGAVQIMYTQCTHLVPIILACIGFGLGTGCFMTIMSPVIVSMVGVSRYPRAQAIYYLGFGTGALFSIPAAGYLVDVTGDFNMPFYVLGSIEIAGGIVFCLLPLLQRRQQDLELPSIDIST